MAMANIRLPFGKIFWGNILLILCSICYLAWWAAAFKPHAEAGTVRTVILFAATAASGMAGLILAVKGCIALPHGELPVSGMCVFLGGAAAYLLLLCFTGIFLKRQVTTELLLIVGWSVLELYTADVLRGAGIFGSQAAAVTCVAVVAAAVISIVCYLLYYRLEEKAGYIAGMIPLILAAAVMLGTAAGMAAAIVRTTGV